MKKEYKKVKIKNGEIRYVFDVSLGTVSGKRKRTTIRAKTVKEGRQKVAELQLGNRQIIERSDAITVGSAYRLFLTDIKSELSPTTFEARERFVVYLRDIEDIKLKRFNERDIEAWMSRQECKQETLRYRYSVLAVFLKWCYRHKMISSNPTEYVRKPKRISKEMAYITEAEFWKIYRHIRKDKFKLVFILLFYTGLRKGEICALTTDSLKDGELHIDHTIKRVNGKLSVSDEMKTAGSRRIVPLPKWLIHDYKTYFDSCSEEYPFMALYHHIGNYWDKIQECEKLPKHIRIHDLRHSYCALLLSKGVDIYTASKLLGHSSVDITARVYAHLYDKKRKAVADVF